MRSVNFTSIFTKKLRANIFGWFFNYKGNGQDYMITVICVTIYCKYKLMHKCIYWTFWWNKKCAYVPTSQEKSMKIQENIPPLQLLLLDTQCAAHKGRCTRRRHWMHVGNHPTARWRYQRPFWAITSNLWTVSAEVPRLLRRPISFILGSNYGKAVTSPWTK